VQICHVVISTTFESNLEGYLCATKNIYGASICDPHFGSVKQLNCGA